MTKTVFLVLLVLTAISPVLSPALMAAPTLVYPGPETSTDARHEYFIKLLQLAIDRAGGHYVLKQSPVPMPQSRALVQLQNGKDIDVAISMTSVAREQQLRPIRIPLDKGLIGWRVFLIRQEDAEKFKNIRSIDELKKMLAVQGHDWPDLGILRANGFRVEAVAAYEGMFRMLQSQRANFFPRSVIEVETELQRRPQTGLMIEPSIALRYPAAFYFFVHRNNTALAGILETGLKKALQDGSFDKLFEQYLGAAARQANLASRAVFCLSNPYLPPETPLDQKQFWYAPKPASGGRQSPGSCVNDAFGEHGD